MFHVKAWLNAIVSSFCIAPQQVRGVLEHPELHARYATVECPA